jgi:hypothetical protein
MKDYHLHLYVIAITIITTLLLIYYYFKHRKNEILILYFIVMTCIEISSYFYGKVYGNNLIFGHINALCEFILLSLYFKSLLSSLNTNVEYIKPFIILGSIFLLTNGLLLKINFIGMTFTSFIVLFYCLYTFYKMLDVENMNDKKLHLMFVTCIFLMHSTSLVVMYFYDTFMTLQFKYQMLIINIRSMMIFITKILFLITIINTIIYHPFNLKKASYE